jgi:hypothetical protein
MDDFRALEGMFHGEYRSMVCGCNQVGQVREISVRRQVSGKALAAGITASLVDQEPATSAVPLTYFERCLLRSCRSPERPETAMRKTVDGRLHLARGFAKLST